MRSKYQGMSQGKSLARGATAGLLGVARSNRLGSAANAGH